MNEIDYINLIHRQLSGDISNEEMQDLTAWLEADPENKLTAEAIQAVWENTSFEEPDLTVDLDHEFALLTERIEADSEENSLKEEKETKVIPLRRRLWSVAAGVAVILTIAGLWNKLGGGSDVKWNELSTTDQPAEIKLADGSMIYLNANSTLKYPQSFDGATREVELIGEGFFNIAKDPQHPFTVHTAFEDVTVLGTSFNVRAYENESNSEIVVSTGKVQVSSGSANSQILLPNEKAIVDRSNGAIAFETTEDLNESSWHTKKIEFHNAPLSEVLEDIEDYYNISFEYGVHLKDCEYTSTFVNEKLDTVLEAISTVFGLEVNQVTEAQYELVGGSCQ